MILDLRLPEDRGRPTVISTVPLAAAIEIARRRHEAVRRRDQRRRGYYTDLDASRERSRAYRRRRREMIA